MLLAIQFARFGPYHLARLRSAIDALEPHGWKVIGIQSATNDATYGWEQMEESRIISVCPGRRYEEIGRKELKDGVTAALDRLRPDAIAIAGWATPDATVCLRWCRRNRTKAILMSETRAADGRRYAWKEWLKSRIVNRFDAALVGGQSHRDYLVSLGMPAKRVTLGYDVVDEIFFQNAAQKWRDAPDSPPYFLASNRFVPRKNITTLVRAYGIYASASPNPWPMVLLGDGEQRPRLLSLCKSLGLPIAEHAPWEVACSSPIVFFPGFRQIEELPRFYAQAGCFIHPALQEPWGLVLNEAAACALPLLSGNNVGAAEELLEQGVNGWKLDTEDVGAISAALEKTATLTREQRHSMGQESLRILKERAPLKAFGEGLARALETAV